MSKISQTVNTTSDLAPPGHPHRRVLSSPEEEKEEKGDTPGERVLLMVGLVAAELGGVGADRAFLPPTFLRFSFVGVSPSSTPLFLLRASGSGSEKSKPCIRASSIISASKSSTTSALESMSHFSIFFSSPPAFRAPSSFSRCRLDASSLISWNFSWRRSGQ